MMSTVSLGRCGGLRGVASVVVFGTLAAAAIVVASPSSARANDPSPAQAGAARRDATAMQQAFMRGDLDTFVRYTHPKLVEMIGGKEKMIAMMKEGMAKMSGDGFSFKSVEVSRPLQQVRAGRDLHAILPMMLVMKTPQGDLRVTSYLLGISSDKGESWTFMDTAQLDEKKVRMLLPTFNKNLRIPAKPEPALTAKPAGE